MRALKEQTIIRQGEPGHEMYFIIHGEVEVTVRDDTVPHIDAGQQKQRRLGFLSEGPFFGEAPVLAARDDTSMQVRNAIFAPFLYKMHHFAKTGSGQT